MANLPAQQDVAQKLGSFRDTLYVSLYKALLYSKDHFRESDHRFSPNFFAYHVRMKLCELLSDSLGVVVEEVENDGVRFVLEKMRFWCLKAQNGKVPSPGDSKNHLEFCKQHGRSTPTQLALVDDAFGFQPVEIPDVDLNLYLLWDATGSQELAFVQIVCPRDAIPTEVYYEWVDPIENPFASGSIFDAAQEPSNEREDLTFPLRDDTTEENLNEDAQ
jgi:hypothetical protein